MPNDTAYSFVSEAEPFAARAEGVSCERAKGLTLLRKEDAIALVMSVLNARQLHNLEPHLLRAYAPQILLQQCRGRYRYENSISEIVDDLVWMMH